MGTLVDTHCDVCGAPCQVISDPEPDALGAATLCPNNECLRQVMLAQGCSPAEVDDVIGYPVGGEHEEL